MFFRMARSATSRRGLTCGIEAGGGTRVVLGMVQVDRARVSDFVRSDGSLRRVLVVLPEVRPGDDRDAVSPCALARLARCPVARRWRSWRS
jgi:hypothetical protein